MIVRYSSHKQVETPGQLAHEPGWQKGTMSIEQAQILAVQEWWRASPTGDEYMTQFGTRVVG